MTQSGHSGDPLIKQKAPDDSGAFEFRQRFSTRLVQYLCTLPMRGGLHRGRDSIDDGETRAAAPGRGWPGRISAASAASGTFQLFAAQTLPAGSMATSVTIWMLPLWKTWMTSPGFVPAGCPFGVVPGHQHDAARPHKLPTQTSSLPSMFKPHGTLIAPRR